MNSGSNVSTGDHSFSFSQVVRCVTLERHFVDGGRAHRNTLAVFLVISGPNSHSQLNVCTPISLEPDLGLFRRPQTTTRVGGTQERKKWGVREMEEGGRAWHHQCQAQLPGDG